MNYDYFKSTGSGISVDSNTPGNGKYRYSNYVLDEIGGAFFATPPTVLRPIMYGFSL